MSGTVSTTSSASALSSCAPMESKITQNRTITTDDKQIKAENSGTSFLASFFTDVRLHINNIQTRSSCASIMWMTVGTLDVDHRRCAMRMCIGRLETISCRYCHFVCPCMYYFPLHHPDADTVKICVQTIQERRLDIHQRTTYSWGDYFCKWNGFNYQCTIFQDQSLKKMPMKHMSLKTCQVKVCESFSLKFL
jgi:hypothetical protein